MNHQSKVNHWDLQFSDSRSNSYPEKHKDQSLESVRGLAAVNVLFAHFLVMFFPYLGNNLWNDRNTTVRAVAQKYPVEEIFGSAPFTILFNGTFPVCIFFVLSGYVLSQRFIQTGDRGVLYDGALKRLPRIIVPVLASVLLAWALLTAGLMATAEGPGLGAASWLTDAYTTPVSFGSALWLGLVGAPLLGQTVINAPLWTMRIELMGSFLIFAAFWLAGRHRPWLAAGAFFSVLLLFNRGSSNNIFFLGFLIGALIHYVRPLIYGRAWLTTLLLMVGLLLGGFDYSAAYYWLDNIQLPSMGPFVADLHGARMSLYFTAGAALVIAAVVASPRVSRWLSHGALTRLGRVSFALYLIHWPIMCSLSLHVAAFGLAQGLTYPQAVALSAAVSFPAIFLAASLFTRAIDEPAIALAKRFSKRIRALL